MNKVSYIAVLDNYWGIVSTHSNIYSDVLYFCDYRLCVLWFIDSVIKYNFKKYLKSNTDKLFFKVFKYIFWKNL